jgi:hypothetical protein
MNAVAAAASVASDLTQGYLTTEMALANPASAGETEIAAAVDSGIEAGAETAAGTMAADATEAVGAQSTAAAAVRVAAEDGGEALGTSTVGAAATDAGSSVAGFLPNDALVVRGGLNTPESVASGFGTHPSGVTGVSVESAPGKSVAELAAGPPPIYNSKVGVTTVGDVRALGGDVIPTQGMRPNHATLTGLTPQQISGLLQPPIPNPAR